MDAVAPNDGVHRPMQLDAALFLPVEKSPDVNVGNFIAFDDAEGTAQTSANASLLAI